MEKENKTQESEEIKGDKINVTPSVSDEIARYPETSPLPENMEKENKGCGKKITTHSGFEGRYHICGSDIYYSKDGGYVCRHRNVVYCEDCENAKTKS